MTETSPTPGRRGNGLSSAEWGALVDLDPRLSEALLDSLAAEGVAAFVEPAAGVDTVSRAVTMPERPLDRLWVDPSRAEQARVVVAAEVADLTALLAEDEPGATAYGLVRPVPRTAATRVLLPPPLPGPSGAPRPPSTDQPEPALGPLDDDEAFRQIVAGYALDGGHEVPPWPVAEDLDPPAVPPPAAPPPAAGSVEPPQARRRRSDRPDEAPLPSWLEPDALEDNGHFVPPPPPPVPRIRLRTVGASVLLLLGLLLLFAPGLLRQQSSSGVILLGLVTTAGGAGLLVWWMRDAHPDGGPDSGAVV